MSSISEQIYQKHHVEFEKWFTSIHPNHELNFKWEYVYDSGWYKEDMANGAWIAWSALNAKGCGTDTVESLAKEVRLLNGAQLTLSSRVNATLTPLAEKLIEGGEVDKLKSLVSTFPECPVRMKLVGKISLDEHQ
jgi:hypothetical protein